MGVAHIEHFCWDHTQVSSQFADLRVRSAFTDNADLVWVETFGKDFSPIFDKIKTTRVHRDFALSQLRKTKKGSAERTRFFKVLKPLTKQFNKFTTALKLFEIIHPFRIAV